MDENRDKKIGWLWLIGNILAWIPISGVAMAMIQRRTGGLESSELPTMVVVAAINGGIFTFFFVSLPSRIAINLLVVERRNKRRRETLLCVLTFVVLCWAALSIKKGALYP
jgi:hypothetical protein